MEHHDDHVRALVEEALRTGLLFMDVLSTLIEDLPADAFPGEDPARVLVEMTTGSMRPVAEAAGEEAVAEATALFGALSDRLIGDLEQAMELARARSA